MINDKNSIEKTLDESPSSSGSVPPENDSSLEALVREEQSIARERLREQFGREPTQDEIDLWLSEQTEGY